MRGAFEMIYFGKRDGRCNVNATNVDLRHLKWCRKICRANLTEGFSVPLCMAFYPRALKPNDDTLNRRSCETLNFLGEKTLRAVMKFIGLN